MCEYDPADFQRILSTYLKNSTNGVLNSHRYIYDVSGQRTNRYRPDGKIITHTYDSIGQLLTATAHDDETEVFNYYYDPAGNLTNRVTFALTNQLFTVNALNQLTDVTRSGSLLVAGSSSSAATNVTVNGQTALIYPDGFFYKYGLTLTNGTNSVTANAQDSYGRAAADTVTAGFPQGRGFHRVGVSTGSYKHISHIDAVDTDGHSHHAWLVHHACKSPEPGITWLPTASNDASCQTMGSGVHIDIVAVARDVGDHALVDVRSHDPSIHAVSACVGARGVYPKNIVREPGR